MCLQLIHRLPELLLKNNDQVKKTIFKMAEPPENGVQMIVFLTEVNFSFIG